MTNNPGTYLLLTRSARQKDVQIGRLGSLALSPGYYVYVGSAFGPGGIDARVRHHCRISSRPHWHIDYLRFAVSLEQVWFTHDPLRREHQWARTLVEMRLAAIPLKGFGASDCHCKSHLIYFRTLPRLETFRHNIERAIPGHSPIALADRPCEQSPGSRKEDY